MGAAAARRGRARLPARPPDHGPHRRRRRLVRPARADADRAGRAARAGPRRRASTVGVVGSGSNLLVADDGFHGLAIKLDGELAAIEREGEPPALRRRRPPALGGGESRRLGALRARVRDQHPRHRRRRGADERQRLRRPARRGPRVGRRRDRRRGRPPRPRTSSASPTGARTWARARSSPGPASALRPADPEAIRATLASMRDRRREAQPSGIKTFGSTFKNPDGSPAPKGARPASCSRPPAAGGCGSAAPASPRSTPTSSRTIEGATRPTCWS